MKIQFKNPINIYAPVFLMLMSMLVLGFGCNTSKPTPDPLAGWTFRTFDQFEPPSGQNHYHLDKAITDDYQDFIAKNKLDLVGAITGFFEDGTGQHGVQFLASPPNQNAAWTYVLIYDRENKRIKEMKYGYHGFRS